MEKNEKGTIALVKLCPICNGNKQIVSEHIGAPGEITEEICYYCKGEGEFDFNVAAVVKSRRREYCFYGKIHEVHSVKQTHFFRDALWSRKDLLKTFPRFEIELLDMEEAFWKKYDQMGLYVYWYSDRLFIPQGPITTWERAVASFQAWCVGSVWLAEQSHLIHGPSSIISILHEVRYSEKNFITLMEKRESVAIIFSYHEMESLPKYGGSKNLKVC